MAPNSTILSSLKLAMILVLAAWICMWILRPTQLWKKSWHVAEDRANATILGDYGLNVVVFCFPVLAVATLGYTYLHLCVSKGRLRQRISLMTNFSSPLIISRPVGILSGLELLFAAVFVLFLVWTYYSNVSGDFKKMPPYKPLQLNRWQLKMMRMGVRIGSLSEACLALLLLPILRGMAVFRIVGIQFEASVRYHMWIGNAMILLSVLHGITIMSVWAVKRSFLEEITKWQRTGRVYIAGAIALVTGVIIWLTSLPPVRRKQFKLFYLAHHLYMVFILFFLLHAGAGHFYLVIAGVLLFALDKILRVMQSRRETCLISACVLPCKAVELTLPKHPSMKYTPTSSIFIKIPAISKFQWHPFSIISSSNMDDDRFSVLVKCQGQWTNALFDMVNSMADAGSGNMNSLCVAVEGPYGPATFPHQRYDSLVLVAGGSGITPFLSILQDAASRNGNISKYPTKIQLIYVVKRLQDLSMLTPISPLLINQSGELGHLKLKIFVTQEEGTTTIVREMFNDLPQVKTIVMDRNSSVNIMARPEGLLWKATITMLSFLTFLASLVCLSHIFIHQGKKSSESKYPSWVNDLLVLCSFVIATSSCSVATVLLRWRKSANNVQLLSRKYTESAEMHYSRQLKGALEEHEINFGRRPNLIDILSELSAEIEESKVGVFVCGPYSMRESVATFCRAYLQKSNGGDSKQKCHFNYHSVNFSL
ncbi:ferric reduction oxidase 8, mitochondrial isoform X2 [Phoenix dactylifera]|uniref:Ferric reduction oxidase 8, mitochondrial isoform X2 n=1 Tax=Phoenix dactylifera TaxID=42345 RepID=A0A8B7BHY8_PHODC|nr:ferric reduction oxidase 8, mitochondrial isoform X2 [Phoenix dactylifera]